MRLLLPANGDYIEYIKDIRDGMIPSTNGIYNV